ncbi:RNase adapter RapZ [Shimia sp.]|uniref:RNase adapter RapZ n=1 Tax=Shimia sp. TaxID=1954381 RepID=UPI0032976D66
MTPDDTSSFARLVLVTGPSGAGRSTAIGALEDAGYETIDNMPLGLLPRLFSGPPLQRPMALGVDARNRDFSPRALLDALDVLSGLPGPAPELLYLDCRAEVLQRRYNETRRRHPMAPDESPREGIVREFSMLEMVRDRADVLIDTSSMSPHELRASVEKWFAPQDRQPLAISVQSFSYKRGLPQGADLVFDCRFLRNPHWVADLRALNGTDAPVGAYVAGDENYSPFVERLMGLVELVLPAYVSEGRSHLMIAFGCTGGKHRSVYMAETVAEGLAQGGWQVSIRHRELNRFATLPGQTPRNTEDGEQTA